MSPPKTSPKTADTLTISDIRRLFETSSDANVVRDCVLAIGAGIGGVFASEPGEAQRAGVTDRLVAAHNAGAPDRRVAAHNAGDAFGTFLTQYGEYLEGKRDYIDIPTFPSGAASTGDRGAPPDATRVNHWGPPAHPTSLGQVWVGETQPTPSQLAEALGRGSKKSDKSDE